MKINVHAGHNPAGKVACGAVGILNESTEARKVKNEVISRLRSMGHTVYDCTVDNGTSQNDVLAKIVKKCNAHRVDLDVSIHFNAGRKDGVGDGRPGGTEVYIYSREAGAYPFAKRTAEEIGKLGFPIREEAAKDHVKINPGLYVLQKTKDPAMLVECCFIDDRDDVLRYRPKEMAGAIVRGITGALGTSKSGAADTLYGQYSPPAGNAYFPRYTGNSGSIVMALKSLGIDASFANRKRIAIRNKITNYQGTAAQNVKMLSMLKAGKLAH